MNEYIKEQNKKYKDKEINRNFKMAVWSILIISVLYIFFGIMNDLVSGFGEVVSYLVIVAVFIAGVPEIVREISRRI